MKKLKKLFIILGLIILTSALLLVGYNFWVQRQMGEIDLKNLGPNCNFAGSCGNLVGINCKAEVDGPFYYVNKNTGKIVEYCGGYCMGGNHLKYCRHCPPKEWTCKTY